ncbi:methyltransferase family protein [Saccharothrix carnea]|uniref:Methyltransferase family protein n=1 Tax=Saccharothrix carnea TaxID=1280637 RepID=A0A2P8I329_SACCR|nr:class I SAM-dependent methyltransferase [Saccharothrix carnea]PSL52853.1 methyltransferase family protein [Saccharothrix carnea]
MDLSVVAVPHTLAHLTPLLPAPPARVLEVGCGRGALAAALGELGYQVTGVDRDAEMAAAARERGVRVVQADVREVSGEYDVVLFTRSLHHAEDLAGVVDHAAGLVVPGGQVVIEEFAWERVDHAGAHFLHDNRALLVAAGLLDAEPPSGDPLDAWVAGHDFLHRGSALIAALGRVGSDLTTVGTSILWRLVNGRGGVWTEPGTHTADVLDTIRAAEERRMAAGLLPPVGLIASVRR